MSLQQLGAVTIGQRPRPDLLEPLLTRAGSDAEIVETGALDDLTAAEIVRLAARRGGEASGTYPLTTRLRDGSPVTLDERDLAPLVQRAIDRAEEAGADVTLLLCAGGFLDIAARGELVRPFDAAAGALRNAGARRIAVVVPYPGQADAAGAKWAAAGFESSVVVGDPATVDLGPAGTPDAIVLDYVGHPFAAVDALRSRSPIPVYDLGERGADAAIAALRRTRRAIAAAGAGR